MMHNFGQHSLTGSSDYKPNQVTDTGAFALQSRVKAMHHWIKKGNSEKAQRMAASAAHVANAILRIRG